MTEPQTGSVTSSVVTHNRLSANRLSANRLSANRLSANRLSANRLSANRLLLTQIDNNDLECTADGREVLAFIVSCAIDEGVTVTATNMHATCGTSDPEPDTFDFFGEIGLANRWMDHPLNDTGKGWISACLFSRVSANDVPIPISLRGHHHNLTATADEKIDWNLEEGAFYGNYFETLPGHDDLPDWHVCRGRDQAAGETGGLIDRDCAEPDPMNPGFSLCGFAYAGDCGDFSPSFACEGFNDSKTFYKDCAGEDIFENNKNGHTAKKHHAHDKTYEQVITVYDFNG